MSENNKRKLVNNWFIFLQSEIYKEFKNIEIKASKNKRNHFLKKVWEKKNKNEGGGTSYLLKNGSIFEKVGINRSSVCGKFKKKFRKKIPGAENDGKYWASGVSVVAHMQNPKIPAIHFNTRFITTSKEWFGGGVDVTPSHLDLNEKLRVHKKLKEICIQNKKNYKKYKKLCSEYFYLPHRNEERGIGGIFFDYEYKNWEDNFKFIRDLGFCFIEIAKEIIIKKANTKWTSTDKEKQLIKRGRYAEFNLLYDRGTKFGLNTGGNVESILMSMPPEAKWK